jgi:hypothetical protein
VEAGAVASTNDVRRVFALLLLCGSSGMWCGIFPIHD